MGFEQLRYDTFYNFDFFTLGMLKWTPPKDAEGKALGIFTFIVKDSSGAEDTEVRTLTINVRDVTDTLKGTNGGDIIDGKGGNDRLTGRDGSDTFVFGRNYDRDTITDFVATGKDHDVIDLSKLSSITDFADLEADHISQHGHDVWIDGGKGDVLVLKGVDISDLGKGDFIF